MKTTTVSKLHDERIAALHILADPHPVGSSVHHMADSTGINGSSGQLSFLHKACWSGRWKQWWKEIGAEALVLWYYSWLFSLNHVAEIFSLPKFASEIILGKLWIMVAEDDFQEEEPWTEQARQGARQVRPVHQLLQVRPQGQGDC